jgi:hypothetical protein
MPDWRKQYSDKIVVGYVGNMGEAHSAESVAKMVRAADPERFCFLFSLYGAKADQLKSLVKHQPHVEWTEGIPDMDLPWLDAQIVSLLPEWTNICVPSKGVSAICAGNPIIYIGLEDSDIYQFFKNASWLIRDDRLNLDSDIKLVLKVLSDPDAVLAKKSATAEYAAQQDRAYQNGLDELVQWIRSL